MTFDVIALRISGCFEVEICRIISAVQKPKLFKAVCALVEHVIYATHNYIDSRVGHVPKVEQRSTNFDPKSLIFGPKHFPMQS